MEQASKLTSDEEDKEPVIKLHKIAEAMQPPLSLGENTTSDLIHSNENDINATGLQTPSRPLASTNIDTPDISSTILY